MDKKRILVVLPLILLAIVISSLTVFAVQESSRLFYIPFSDSLANGISSHGGVSSIDQGKIGKADYFDGFNGYLSINQSKINYSLTLNKFTWSAWVYKAADGNMMLINHGTGTGGNGGYLNIFNSKLMFTIGNGAGVNVQVTDTSDFPLKSWQYVAVSYNGSVAKVYRNKTLIGTSTPVLFTTPTGNLTIGAFIDQVNFSKSFQYFNGTLDEIKIYNTSLTAEEILADSFVPNTIVDPFCIDTDGDYNLSVQYFIQAKVNTTFNGVPILYEDACEDSNALLEYYCNGTSVNHNSFTCPNGCSEKACIGNVTYFCNKVGGLNYSSAGFVNFTALINNTVVGNYSYYYDSCSVEGEEILLEFNCDINNHPNASVYLCPTNYACSSGICVLKNNTGHVIIYQNYTGECNEGAEPGCTDDQEIILCINGQWAEPMKVPGKCDYQEAQCDEGLVLCDGVCKSSCDTDVCPSGQILCDDGSCKDSCGSSSTMIIIIVVIVILIIAVIGVIAFILMKKGGSKTPRRLPSSIPRPPGSPGSPPSTKFVGPQGGQRLFDKKF
ncbi:MAG: LamG domain-containing protein [Candidatus Pacearchaeota archaeon]|jgi:hypothetical protein